MRVVSAAECGIYENWFSFYPSRLFSSICPCFYSQRSTSDHLSNHNLVKINPIQLSNSQTWPALNNTSLFTERETIVQGNNCMVLLCTAHFVCILSFLTIKQSKTTSKQLSAGQGPYCFNKQMPDDYGQTNDMLLCCDNSQLIVLMARFDTQF